MKARAEFCIPGRDRLARPYRYEASGLDYVFLLNGVTIQDTPYGSMVNIKNVHGLHRAIGLHIIERSTPMTGAEFRFLRKQMGMTQSALASLMRTTDQTVANYEKNKTEPGPAEALLRLTYLLHVVPEETRADILKPVIDQFRVGGYARLPDLPRQKIVQTWQEQSGGMTNRAGRRLGRPSSRSSPKGAAVI